MSEDKYFKEKSKDLLSRIIDEYESNKDEEDLEILIIFCLKEVARDQRYACVDAINNIENEVFSEVFRNHLRYVIQNAQIEKGE